MEGKTHKVWGLAAGLATISVPQTMQYLTEHTNTLNEAATAGVVLGIGSLLGGLFADVDNETSTAGFWMRPFFCWLYRKEKTKKSLAFYHRHLFHSIWIPLIFLTLFVATSGHVPTIVSALFLGLSVGMVSHALMDWIMSKVSLLSPFTEKGFSLLHLENNPKAQKICDTVFYILGWFVNAFLVTKGVIV